MSEHTEKAHSETLTASELIALLQSKVAEHGDRALYLCDADTGWLVTLTPLDLCVETDRFVLGHEDYTRIDR